MTDIDGLLQMCLASPADADRRGILCDALAESGETELEAALRGQDGEAIIRRLYTLADSLKRSACLRLLWSVVVVEGGVSVTRGLTADDVRQLQEAVRHSTRRRAILTLPDPSPPVEKHAKPRLTDLKWTTPTPPVGPT